MSDMRRFINLAALFFGGLVLLVTAMTYVVNPYGIFVGLGIAAINFDKTQAVWQPQLAKAYLVEKIEPRTLLIGDSRVDLGLNPESVNWKADYKPIFNLGIPGSTLREQLRYFQHALSHYAPKTVVVGQAFEDCFVWPLSPRNSAPSANNDQDKRLEGGSTVSRYARFQDYVFALLSIDSLRDSIMTLINQHKLDTAYMSSLGWRSSGDFGHSANADGYYNLVMDKDRTIINTMLDWAKSPECDLGPLRAMIDLATGHNIDIIVILTPSYIDDLEIIRQTNLLARYDAWKRALANIIFEAGREGGNIVLWDFNRIDTYTTELLPGRHERTYKLRWFWETKHFKVELGNEIIDTLMGYGPPDFGTRLLRGNIEYEITHAHDLLAIYERNHAPDVDRIAALVSANRENRCAQDHNTPCSIATRAATLLSEPNQ